MDGIYPIQIQGHISGVLDTSDLDVTRPMHYD
jgi:hypothetical protein